MIEKGTRRGNPAASSFFNAELELSPFGYPAETEHREN